MAKEFKFCSLKFPKELIKKIYEYPKFAYILFKWKKHVAEDFYILWGIAYDEMSNELPLDYFDLEIADSGGTKKLAALTLGILVLSKEMMSAQEMKGSTDAFFKPKKFGEEEGSPKDYVSYKISSHKDELLIKDFTLNPSPPR